MVVKGDEVDHNVASSREIGERNASSGGRRDAKQRSIDRVDSGKVGLGAEVQVDVRDVFQAERGKEGGIAEREWQHRGNQSFIPLGTLLIRSNYV